MSLAHCYSYLLSVIVIKQSFIILSSISPFWSHNDHGQLCFICSLQDVEKTDPPVRSSHDGEEVLAPNRSLQCESLIGQMPPDTSLSLAAELPEVPLTLSDAFWISADSLTSAIIGPKTFD